MQRKILLRCKTEYLLRLAKWLKLDIKKDISHNDLAEMIYFNMLYV